MTSTDKVGLTGLIIFGFSWIANISSGSSMLSGQSIICIIGMVVFGVIFVSL